ncbi:MAG: barstar family protein [Smithellaceae bacterium]|nr:barstar family protein [Smithellaceae bacterium]
MPIKRCALNGLAIRSLDDLYDQLSSRLSLPAHSGRNLDALWDVLSTDVEGPFKIVWKHSDDSKKSMGRDFDRVVKLLQELEGERDDFQLTIEP